MIRTVVRTDQAYIASTWTRSVCSTHAYRRHVGSRTWQDVSTEVDAVMDRPDTRGIVFAPAHDRHTIYGWLVYAEGPAVPVVHYLYVRQTERALSEHGRSRPSSIASQLLGHLNIGHQTAVVCTSLGPSSETMRGRYKASVYMPLAEFLGEKT